MTQRPDLPLQGPRFPSKRARLLVALAAAALTACGTSVPLPPWPGGSTASPAPPANSTAATGPQRSASPGVVVSAPAAAAPPAAVVVTPVAQAPLAAADGPLPYSSAVAARFPEPRRRYDTPGLAAGRGAFTSDEEIRTWLRAQVGAASARGTVRAGLVPAGVSQSGVPMEALVLTTAAATDGATVVASGRPTVLLVGQQHGDEPAGAEALLHVARELAQGSLAPLLARINVVLLPRANPDGAGQLRRTTASGVDMNRDHLLLQTPEARAVAHLARSYRPAVVVDAHEYTVVGRFLQKYGAVQRFDAMLQYATTPNMPELVTRAAEEWFRQPLLAALSAEGLTHEWYYTTSTDLADRRVQMGGVLPDTGRNVYGLTNAVSLLVETRGVGIGRLHIQRRVHTHAVAVASVLQSAAQRADDLQQLRDFVGRDVAAQACRAPAVIAAAATPEPQRPLLMLDPDTGADRSTAVEWMSALRLQARSVRERPCGYWLAAGAGDAAVERLRAHGVAVQRIAEPTALVGQTYRETARREGAREDVRGAVADGSASARHVEVELVRAAIDANAGSYYVPLAQPLAHIAIAALEPDTQSSYFANRIVGSLDGVARVTAPPAVRLDDMR